MVRAVLPVALALGLVAPVAAQDSTAVAVEIAVGRRIVDRLPADTAAAFPADVGQLACWTRVTGGAGTAIQHVWIHGEHEWPVTLEIGGSPWRTWTTKEIQPEWTGDWRVEVRDAAGAVLATARFTVGQ
jgi:hypothetical protein